MAHCWSIGEPIVRTRNVLLLVAQHLRERQDCLRLAAAVGGVKRRDLVRKAVHRSGEDSVRSKQRVKRALIEARCSNFFARRAGRIACVVLCHTSTSASIRRCSCGAVIVAHIAHMIVDCGDVRAQRIAEGRHGNATRNTSNTLQKLVACSVP